MALIRASSPRFKKKRGALESSKLVKKSLILAYSLLYSGGPALLRLGSIILGFALGSALDFVLGLSVRGI